MSFYPPARPRHAGFSLMMVSIILAVAAIVMVSLLPGQEAGDYNAKENSTVHKLDKVEAAMRSFMAFQGRRPCPADGQYDINSANFGVEGANQGTCTGGTPAAPLGPDVGTGLIVGGTIPTKTLNLPDDYAFDEWGRRLTYVVDTRATQKNSCISLQGAHMTGVGGVAIKNGTAGTTIDQTMYAYISHGPDGHGAWPAQGSTVAARLNTGSTDQDQNTNAGTSNDGNFTYSTANFTNVKVNKDRTATFDDVLWYSPDIKNTCCLGTVCAATGPPGFRIDGMTFNVGLKLYGTADLNGDGIPDLILGDNAGGGTNWKGLYVVFGRSDRSYPNPLPLNTLNGTNGFAINVISWAAGDISSMVVGDFNGDGVQDIAFAQGITNCVWSNPVVIIYGQKTPFPASVTAYSVSNATNPQGTLISGSNTPNGLTCPSLAAGNLTGATNPTTGLGIDDLIIGVSGESNYVGGSYRGALGDVYVVLGNATPPSGVDAGLFGPGIVPAAGYSYNAYTTTPFTVTAGSHTIEFFAVGTGFLVFDDVVINGSATQLSDPGFENPQVGAGNSPSGPASPYWTFGGHAGFAGTGALYPWWAPPAPEGNQAAFFSWPGDSISQAVTLAAGTYTISFSAAESGGMKIEVLIDGIPTNNTLADNGNLGFIIYGPYANANFGASLTIGDFNGDGIKDLGVLAVNGGGGGSWGEATIIWGQKPIVSTYTYTKRKAITIDHTKVGGSDLTNFPLLVSFSGDTDIGGAASGAGQNIRFTASDGTTTLPYERQSFSITGGAATGVFWVNVPSVSHTADTTIYIYYDQPTAPEGQNAAATWSNYAGVWHLEQNPGGSAPQMTDSKGSNNGTSNGTTSSAAGTIGNGVALDGSTGYIAMGDVDAQSGAFTVEGIAHPTSDGSDPEIVTRGCVCSGTYQQNYLLYERSSTGANKWGFQYTGSIYTDANETLGTSRVALNSWSQVVGVYNAPNDASIYVNGILENHNTSGTTTPYSGTGPTLDIGSYNDNNGGYFAGTIDEVRISSVARSAGWINFEYHNIFDAGNDITFSAQQAGSLVQSYTSYSVPASIDTAALPANGSVGMNIGFDGQSGYPWWMGTVDYNSDGVDDLLFQSSAGCCGWGSAGFGSISILYGDKTKTAPNFWGTNYVDYSSLNADLLGNWGSGDLGFGDSGAGSVNLTGTANNSFWSSGNNPWIPGNFYYVIYPALPTWMDMSQLNGSNGFRFGPLSTSSSLGIADVNQDGINDMLIGDGNANSTAGAAWVLWGTASGPGVATISEGAATQYATQFNGATAQDYAGAQVTMWDADHDGIADAVICAYNASYGAGRGGSCYVYWGKPKAQWPGTPAGAPGASPPALADAGFETPVVGNGNYAWSAGAWSGTELSGNNSAFTSGNPNAPEGAQVGVFQGSSSTSQAVTFSQGGNYAVRFIAAQRGNFGGANTIAVQVDGTTIDTITPSGTNYTTYTTKTFTVTAGSHTIGLVGSPPDGADRTVFIDAVSIIGSGTPATYNAVNLSDINAAASR